MEDPWANAWGESSKPDSFSANSASSAWSAPSVSAIHGDHEDDLSLPSWSSQAEVQWTDPDNTGTSLWTSDPSTIWNPTASTFDQISLTDDSDRVPQIKPGRLSPPPQDDPHSSSPSSPSPPLSIITNDENTSVSPVSNPTISPSSSSPNFSSVIEPPPTLDLDFAEDVDAFGTFETAHEEVDVEEWPTTKPTYSLPSADDAEVWGGAWGTPTPESIVNDDKRTRTELDDAWEVARQQKERQDIHVPPEILASILQELNSVSNDLWPALPSLTADLRDTQRPMDMEEHLGLGPLVQRLIPTDLTLPPNVAFSTTFISKQMSEALKMTRHAPLTRFSPMAFYMSSKGLTSWEASVKAKPNILPDDITPAGWKIIEGPKGEVAMADDAKKKPNGGLLSFFGRRTTNSIDAAPTTRSASPASISATSSTKPRVSESPRPSIDSVRPASILSHKGGSTAPPSPTVQSLGFTSPITTESAETHSISDNTVSSPVITSPHEISQDVETTSQPSVVSRFFGRFSTRPKSVHRDSLALSNDDLEFLADVPTADPHPDSNSGLDALSMMIKSPPLPTALPPPLKPPPRAPPPQPSQIPNNIVNPTEDAMSFFDNPFSSPLGTIPTPPVRSTPIQPMSPSSQILPSDNLPPTAKGSNLPSQTTQTFSNQSWSSFDSPSTSSSLMSKPTQTKRPFVAIMSSSSSRQSSSTPPLLPKPSSGFVLPPPPSSRHTPINSDTGSSSNIPPRLPPPTSRSHTPHIAKPTPSAPTILDDDDDFADFLSSPSQTTQNKVPHSFSDFASGPQVTGTGQPSSTQHAPSNDLFNMGDFDDFMSPTPPQPPAKPVPQKKSPPPLSTEATSNGVGRRTSRAADHARTLSLLESVASRGRWLAPPSPLPEALPPPESNGISGKGDLFSGGSSMQAQQAQATASLTNTFSSPTPYSNTPLEKPPASWNFPPPTTNTPPPPMIPNKQLVTQRYPEKNSSVSGGTKTGGLSAQDLSFFEGL